LFTIFLHPGSFLRTIHSEMDSRLRDWSSRKRDALAYHSLYTCRDGFSILRSHRTAVTHLLPSISLFNSHNQALNMPAQSRQFLSPNRSATTNSMSF
jgi:hypothetical protein